MRHISGQSSLDSTSLERNAPPMMMSHSFLSIVSTFLFSLGMAGALIIVWMGWLRTRRIGYLILAAWAIVAMAGAATSWFYLPLTRKMSVSSQAALQITLALNIGRTVISSVLLLTGLWLLVFGEPRNAPRAEQ
jgi:hypothetical protein